MPIEAITFPQLSGTTAVNQPEPVGATDGPAGPTAPGFGGLVADGLRQLEALTDNAADLSVQAATGDLNAIHDYTIAATEAQVATQLTVAVQTKAIAAFNEIMRMGG